MAYDRRQVEDLAASYTEAWCSRDAARVADRYVPGGLIVINGGEPAAIAEVAAAFIAAFPDIEVVMDDLVGGADGLIAESRGRYDRAEYDRQLREGADPSP